MLGHTLLSGPTSGSHLGDKLMQGCWRSRLRLSYAVQRLHLLRNQIALQFGKEQSSTP